MTANIWCEYPALQISFVCNELILSLRKPKMIIHDSYTRGTGSCLPTLLL